MYKFGFKSIYRALYANDNLKNCRACKHEHRQWKSVVIKDALSFKEKIVDQDLFSTWMSKLNLCVIYLYNLFSLFHFKCQEPMHVQTWINMKNF